VEGAEDQIASHLAAGIRVIGMAAEDFRYRLGNRQHHPAGAGGDAWHGGRDHEFGQGQPITKSHGSLAQQAHEQQGNAAPQPGLDDASGNEEGEHHQPDQVGARGFGDVGKGHDTSKHACRGADDGDGGHGQGGGHDAGDGGDKYREHVPRLHLQAGRRRQEPEDDADSHRD
jgi:hypothetical protein